MEYEEIIKMVVDELTERGYRKLREENEHLNKLIKRRIELKKQVMQCTDPLNEQSKQILEDYYDTVDQIGGIQTDYIYLQGAKDCVRLLKCLGVI